MTGLVGDTGTVERGHEPGLWLTASEVGSRLRMPRSTVYYLAKKGTLPAIQIGRGWRFRRDQIEAIERGDEAGEPSGNPAMNRKQENVT
ncbi:MAG TPA: helix-turn-helix domain-containing protein [Kiritimatiellia bacterium]|nr:helix-turn-helix domain-containing protein [Kiritimatiellia bacterium]